MKKMIVTKNAWSLLCSFCFIFFFAADLAALQGPKLDLKTAIEKEVKVKKQGKWIMERRAADKTAPGDILVFTITYSNTGNGDLVDGAIVNPIPKGVLVNPESAEGKDTEVTCSIDNGRSYQVAPVTVKIKKPDGSLENRHAELETYTHIRWAIKKPVLPGQSGRVSFKAAVK